jgi:hypothetical protein
MSNWRSTSATTPLHRKIERLLPFNPKEFLWPETMGFPEGSYARLLSQFGR